MNCSSAPLVRAANSSGGANTFNDVRRQTIRALHEGGARLLLGSDAPQVFNVPGFSAHRELQAMVLAGLSPYEALHIATAAPAEFFHAAGQYGTIVVGADADFMLVGANPLDDIRNLERIDGVMLEPSTAKVAPFAARVTRASAAFDQKNHSSTSSGPMNSPVAS